MRRVFDISCSAKVLFVLCVVAILLCAVDVDANNYDASWIYRTEITFSGYNKQETLTNFPVLVQLGPNMPNFSYSQFDPTAIAGDLRFLSDDFSTQLDYEVEEWNTNLDLTTIIPTSLPGCILWLKGDAGVVTNLAGGVTGWIDQSLNNNGAAAPAGCAPAYVSNGLNGRPVLSFDGVTNCLTNSTWTPGYNVSGELTYFFVSRMKSPSGSSGFFAQRTAAGYDSGDSAGLSLEQTGGLSRGLRYYRNNSPSIDVLRDNSFFRIDVLRVNASGAQTWLDGLPQGTSSVAFASALAPVEYAIGARDGPAGVNGFGQVDFAEIIIYKTALSTNQLSQVGLYLTEKYGLNTAYKRPGMSYLWVRIPALTNNTSVWAYWGNSSQTNPPGSTTNGATWNSNYRAVWHMGETNVQDWTANANSGNSYLNANVAGFIGRGQNFAGNAYVDLGTRPGLNISGPLTVSSWLYHGTGAGWAFAYGSANAVGASTNWVCDLGLNDSNQWGGEINGPRLNGSVSISEAKSWRHQVVVYDNNAGKVFLYHDGVLTYSANTNGNLAMANLFRLGAKVDLTIFWNGLIDEMRVAAAAESSNWVWASWLNQASNRVFNTYRAVEKTKRGTVMWVQ